MYNVQKVSFGFQSYVSVIVWLYLLTIVASDSHNASIYNQFSKYDHNGPLVRTSAHDTLRQDVYKSIPFANSDIQQKRLQSIQDTINNAPEIISTYDSLAITTPQEYQPSHIQDTRCYKR